MVPPLVHSLFAKAQAVAANSLLCYINSDIILTSDFLPAVQSVKKNDDVFSLGSGGMLNWTNHGISIGLTGRYSSGATSERMVNSILPLVTISYFRGDCGATFPHLRLVAPLTIIGLSIEHDYLRFQSLTRLVWCFVFTKTMSGRILRLV